MSLILTAILIISHLQSDAKKKSYQHVFAMFQNDFKSELWKSVLD